MSRIKELFLFDIIVAIAKIQETTGRFQNANDLKLNYMAWDSVIREFEIVGEATKNLINSELLEGDKREIVNFRNVLIHEYFGIDEEEVFDIAKNKLDDFKNTIISKIKTVDEDIRQELFDEIYQENKHLSFVIQAMEELKHA